MLHCIFHERLENQRWNPGFECLGPDIPLHAQTLSEPHLLDLEVGSAEIDFLGERHFLFPR